MAQLDRLLTVMAGDQAAVLVLEEGVPARIELAAGEPPRPVTKTPLTGTQIVSLLREVAPPDALEELDRGTAAFTYRSTYGTFAASAHTAGGHWCVRISWAKPPVLTLVTQTAPATSSATAVGRPFAAVENAEDDLLAAASPALERIDALLRQAVSSEASDLHLRVGEPPMLRRHGEIIRLAEPPLRTDEVAALVDATMPPVNCAEFLETNDTDFAYEIPGCGRFRANAFRERAGMAAVFRRIPPAIVTVEALGLAPEIQRLCTLTRGLVLVTGPTGSGKSTTLCALIDLVNRTRSDHIITIEDPIEFVHRSQRCIMSQRQVGVHTRSFKTALRAALREDPDVVLIGEMRDLETVSIALETAETGHLVFATLHTTTAATTIDRIIDQFPADQQEQVRVMLADSLRGVISQTLLKKAGGGRVAAREVLFNTPPVANLIRERKTFQLGAVMQTSKRIGMVTITDALVDLVESNQVELNEAFLHAPDKATFLSALKAKSMDISGLEIETPAGARASRATGAARVL